MILAGPKILNRFTLIIGVHVNNFTHTLKFWSTSTLMSTFCTRSGSKLTNPERHWFWHRPRCITRNYWRSRITEHGDWAYNIPSLETSLFNILMRSPPLMSTNPTIRFPPVTGCIRSGTHGGNEDIKSRTGHNPFVNLMPVCMVIGKKKVCWTWRRFVPVFPHNVPKAGTTAGNGAMIWTWRFRYSTWQKMP